MRVDYGGGPAATVITVPGETSKPMLVAVDNRRDEANGWSCDISSIWRMNRGDVADGTERELRIVVSRATDGDADAWEALYRRAYPRLFAYARRRLRSDHEADDAVSETMLRALNGIATFTWKGAGFDAWLYGIARNVVLEAQRHSSRMSSSADPADTETTTAGPLEELVGREQCADVRTAFGRLSAEDQEVLELRVVAGLSADGAGDVLGRRPGAVRMAQSRALGRFRGFFEEVSGAY